MMRRSLLFAVCFSLATLAMFALAQGLDHWRYMAARMGAVEQRLAEARVTLSGELESLRDRQNADAMLSLDSYSRLASQLTGVKADVDSGLQTVNARIDGIPVPHEWDFQRMLKSTVMVKRGGGHGSGVVIGPHAVITNKHVVGDEKTVQVIFHDGSEVEGEVLWASTPGDFALVHVPTLPGDSIVRDVACREPELGEPIVMVGNPIIARQVVTQGIIASLKRLDITRLPPGVSEVPPFYTMDITINGGNSGGPVFDREGKVLGLGTAEITAVIGGMYPTKSGLALMWPAFNFCESLGRW